MQWSSAADAEELIETVLGVVPLDVVLGGGGTLNVELLDGRSLDDEGGGGTLNVELLDGGLLDDEGIGGTLNVELLEGKSLDDEGVGGILNVELLEGKSLDNDGVPGFPAVVRLLELDDGPANKSLELDDKLDDGFAILLDEPVITPVESLELLSGIIESLDDELLKSESLELLSRQLQSCQVSGPMIVPTGNVIWRNA